MRERFFQFTLVVFTAFALLLSGCSDFDEMKSSKLLSQAETLMEQGDELQAEQVLADLVAKYPETQAGEKAGKQLFKIQKQRELRERAEFTKVLESYQQVLDGYRVLYAAYPSSVPELDKSDYFFDSTYLESITPVGYQVYLWLKADGSGYRAWCVSEGKSLGYAVEALSRRLVSFDRDEILNKINSRFQTIVWNSKLVVLQAQE